jgi:choline-sulfatase
MKMGSDPNILILLADQLRPFELGCYGHPAVRTANIDRLAGMGVRFEHAVTPNPVCTPARAALLSGQYGRTCAGSWRSARQRISMPS